MAARPPIPNDPGAYDLRGLWLAAGGDRFPPGSDRCVGCQKDASRALSRPSFPQKAKCAGCGTVYWRFSAWRRFHSIGCARRFGERAA
jgi:uncharacterized protein with PIN domain